MGNEVKASAQCVRDHLQRPDHPDRQLTNAKVGSTVNRTVLRIPVGPHAESHARTGNEIGWQTAVFEPCAIPDARCMCG
jgi:hypothetical protein